MPAHLNRSDRLSPTPGLLSSPGAPRRHHRAVALRVAAVSRARLETWLPVPRPLSAPTTPSPRQRRAERKPIRPAFFFNDTATTEIYTLSLHDALPISMQTCL